MKTNLEFIKRWVITIRRSDNAVVSPENLKHQTNYNTRKKIIDHLTASGWRLEQCVIDPPESEVEQLIFVGAEVQA